MKTTSVRRVNVRQTKKGGGGRTDLHNVIQTIMQNKEMQNNRITVGIVPVAEVGI